MAITSKRAIKFLGMMIGTRLSFRKYLEYIQGKATTRGLARILLAGTPEAREQKKPSDERCLSASSVRLWAEANAQL